MANTVYPSGPPTAFLTGHLPLFRRDPLGFFTRCARDHGDFVPLRFGPMRAFALNHPDLIEQVLVTQHGKFTKGNALRRNRLVFGNGLLVSEGELWRRQRKLMQPAFHRQRIAAYGETMAVCAERVVSGWHDGETRDIHTDMMGLTLEIVQRTLFGTQAAAEAETVGQDIEVLQGVALRRMQSLLLLPEWAPTPDHLRARRAVARLDALIYGLIRERRAEGAGGDDLLSLLLHAADEDTGLGMDDKQLRDEALTLFLAGHETTALALTYALHLLAHHPEVQDRLVAETAQVLQGRAPTVEDRPRLLYAEWVVHEAMRLYPPVWAVARLASEACEIGGYAIPKGALMVMSQWVMNRDPRWFAEPERFRPERWADDLARRLPRHAYFPFGGGPRICIGNTFALMEAVLALATILPRFRVRPVDTAPLELLPSITLRPRDPVRLVVACR